MQNAAPEEGAPRATEVVNRWILPQCCEQCRRQVEEQLSTPGVIGLESILFMTISWTLVGGYLSPYHPVSVFPNMTSRRDRVGVDNGLGP